MQVLADVKEILSELGPKYGFSQAYIFGSTVKAGQFRPGSDVDVAIFNLDTHHFFRVIAALSRRLGRDIDLYQIEKMDEGLRAKVKEQGILWKKPD